MTMHTTTKFAQEQLETGSDTVPVAGKWRHWKRRRDPGGVEWLLFDKADASTNTLSADVMAELDQILQNIEAEPPRALVIRSLKKNGFIAGAEISEFTGYGEGEDTEDVVRRGHSLFNRLEGLKCTTIALIHGFCLGGGLELALCCDYRIARSDSQLGLPEVLLGLHPGLGGTARLTRLIPPVDAMTMMLTGRAQRSKKAKALGLVDYVGEERLFAAAVGAAVEGKLKTRRAGKKISLMNWGPVRRFLAGKMEQKTALKVRKDHYPAPFKLIDLWCKYGGSKSQMLEKEPAYFAGLLGSDTAKNLIRVFFLRDRLKGLGKDSKAAISHVHVIGAGTMGGDIAAWCAFKGFEVTLQDREAKYIAPAMKRAEKLFRQKFRDNGRLAKAAWDRLVPDIKGNGIAQADLIIEAVPEDLKIKHAVFSDVEARMKDSAILATNTSSILLEHMRDDLKRPDRFVGLHFFNPVPKMMLVEVIEHDTLDPAVMAAMMGFSAKIDRLPLPVKSAPGFLVNRALMPYLMETMVLLDEGVAPEAIDASAEAFGMPMGPVELADQVGLDVALHVAGVLKRDLEQDLPDMPGWFAKKVEDGHLGRKTGQGLYSYENGKPVKNKEQSKVDPAIADRLILPLLNTCAACLREEIVSDADLVDAGMIFATGFAPFRGGPMNYAQTRGIDDVVDALKSLEEKHGGRFTPDAGWAGLKR